MKHTSNCLICGAELTYLTDAKEMTCFYCQNRFESNTSCANGHFVCDTCHSASAFDVIKTYCLNTYSQNPVEMAMDLMSHRHVKMHGPEHHFLVPAVLISAFYNTKGQHDFIKGKIEQAGKRAQKILGGFCGFYGACGAAIGTGIFISLVTDSTPLAKLGWKQSNRLTACALLKVADLGGPRCCKRDTFLSLLEAINFIDENFGVSLDVPEKILCRHSQQNKECLESDCPFYDKTK